jgi:hypothetical protein
MRTEIPIVILDNNGKPVPNASVNVYLRGTTNLAAVYQAAAGVATFANPVASDSVGKVTGWLERGQYDCVISAPSLTTYTEPYESAPGGDGSIDTLWLADGAVTSAKLGAGAAVGNLGAGSITTTLIADANVTAAKLAPGAVSAPSASGLYAARPAASSGTSFYYATDKDVLYISNGTTWFRTGPPQGATVLWFKPDAAAPTGWIKYDGSNLPASTGIYDDLYAHLGNTVTTPDTRGRVPVGVGTHAEVASVGLTDGLAVASRRIKHNHTVSGGSSGFVGGGGFGSGSSGFTVTSILVGPQTGFEPTDGSAYITTVLIAKL